MRRILPFYLICIFHYAGYSTDINKTDLLLQRADSLFSRAQYQQAGIGYDQVAYLATDNTLKVHALMRKADCYLLRNNYAAAEQCLLRITYYDLNDSMHYAARYKTALTCYLNSNFEGAESQVLQIKAFIPDSNIVIGVYPLYALILNESNRWTEAKAVLLDYINFRYPEEKQKKQLLAETETLYNTSEIPKLKDVQRAKKLSSILPGTGQIYAGYWGEGILSVSLQALGLGITGLGIWQRYYVTGVLVGFSIYQRFYIGGISRAEFLAQKRNYTVKRKFNDSRKQWLLQLTP